MARPRPTPFSFWFRASSSRPNGVNASSNRSGGMPGPSSSTVISTPPAGVAWRGQRDVLAVRGGVHHQVGERALDGVGAHGGGQPGVGVDRTSAPARTAPSLTSPSSGADVDALQRLAALAAGEGQVLVDHVLHLGEVALHRLDPRAGLGQRQLQLQPGERGAQVVADRGQQGGALVDVALDAVLHGQERLAGLPHLARAVGLERHVGAARRTPRPRRPAARSRAPGCG